MAVAPDASMPDPLSEPHASSVVMAVIGHGWGKSALAQGYVARGYGIGWNSAVIQFVKGPDWHPGIRRFARRIGVQWYTIGHGRTWASDRRADPHHAAQQAWSIARTHLSSGLIDLLVVDEIGFALDYGWIHPDDVTEVIALRSPRTNLILTGTDLPPSVLDACDSITTLERTRDALGRPLLS